MGGEDHEKDAVYTNDRMFGLFNAAFTGKDVENNLPAFKEWLDREMGPDTSTTGLYESVSTLQYQYGADINTYVKTEDGSWGDTDVNAVLSTDGQNAAVPTTMSSRLGAMEQWSEMLSGSDGQLISELVYEQYDLLAGEWPAAANEVVLILDSNNEVTDITLYALGAPPSRKSTK